MEKKLNLMTEPNCLFCWNEEISCVCNEDELTIKPILISFFVASMKEFAPKTARKIPLNDAVSFMNDWYENHFEDSLTDE